MAILPPRLYGDPEFLGEHFDFLPASLMNELYDKYNLIFYKMLDALSKYVQDMPSLTDDQIQQVPHCSSFVPHRQHCSNGFSI